MFQLPIPFGIVPPPNWLKPPDPPDSSHWIRCDDISEAIVASRNSGSGAEPAVVVGSKPRPVILFTNEDTLKRPEIKQYLVLPIYRHKNTTERQRNLTRDIRRKLLVHAFDFPGHDPAVCTLRDSYIDFTQMQTVHRDWFNEEVLNSFVNFPGARHEKNPICRLTPEYMDEVVGALENFLNNYLLVSGPDESLA